MNACVISIMNTVCAHAGPATSWRAMHGMHTRVRNILYMRDIYS